MKKIKWFYLRKKIQINNHYSGYRELNEKEKLIKNIIIKICSNPKNLMLTSLSEYKNKIYIQTEDKEYSVIINGNLVKITNHKFFTETYMEPFFSKQLYKIINKYISKYQTSISTHSDKNELKGLNSILNQLNK
jgi:hypothetical protein